MKKMIKFAFFFCFASLVYAQDVKYGAEEANTKFVASKGMLGGRTDFNYLNLENHPGNSGVPLGGIGVGNVQFAPNGRFVRMGMNNIHEPIRRTTFSFFSLWYKNGDKKEAVRLVNDKDSQCGMQGVDKIFYKGLFPTVAMNFGKSIPNLSANIHAYSSLVPHDLKNSTLPVAFFDVELTSDKDAEVSVAFSWEDFISRGIKDPKNLDGMDGQIFSKNKDGFKINNGPEWPDMPHVQTFAEAWNCSGVSGVRQFSPKPLIPLKAGFQNYVDEVAIVAEQNEGCDISILPSYNSDNANTAWASFRNNGSFDSKNNMLVLSEKDKSSNASAVAIKTHLKAGEKRTVRFMLVWFYPELKINKATAAAGSYWVGGSDYGRYFHNYFDRIEQLVSYAHANRSKLLEKTQEWQEPILASSMPDWYKFKLINSAYVIYTNMILNKKGDMTVNEGGMGGLAGTMDQRISSHPFYQKLFTELDRSERDIFADGQGSDGNITHFIGHYYVGMGTVGGRLPTQEGWMIDNTGGWIIQLAKDYEQTGDIDYLKKNGQKVQMGMKFLKSLIPKDGQIPVGGTTYDDFHHPPIYSYGAGIYLATLKAASVIAEALENTADKAEYDAQFLRTQKAMIDMLWNGKFFSYGCEIDGSKRLDNILFTGQLGGQFVSRYCGWGDIIPMDKTKSSLISQFDISLSPTPDYYANKVWDINQNKGIDNEGSQCWPFYLESYTAYPALEAGFVEDGLEIMKHIQLVHLRKGWTWCQNLWNPGEMTYMTAPVTWFSTDIMAGAGLNVPKHELRLAPIVQGKEKLILPLYYPSFWATLTLDPSTKKASLKVTKTFGDKEIIISKIVTDPVGEGTEKEIKTAIPEFKITENAVLDLTPYWKTIAQTNLTKQLLRPSK